MRATVKFNQYTACGGVALVLLMCLVVPAYGNTVPQPMRQISRIAADCTDHLATTSANDVYSWESLVEVEHCDRIKRLSNIALSMGSAEAPIFYDGSVTADTLSSKNPNIRIPILRVVFPERLFFETGQSDLLPDAVGVVKIIAASLRQEPPDVALFIAGHADARGSRDFNLNLSVDRANAIAAAVLLDGVNQSSVWRVGFGKDMPLKAGHSKSAYDANRRIELLFAAKPEAIAKWISEQQVDLLCIGKSTEQTSQCKAELTLGNAEAVELIAVPPVANAITTEAPERDDLLVSLPGNTAVQIGTIADDILTTDPSIKTPVQTGPGTKPGTASAEIGEGSVLSVTEDETTTVEIDDEPAGVTGIELPSRGEAQIQSSGESEDIEMTTPERITIELVPRRKIIINTRTQTVEAASQ